jgi:hypothetical protein
LQSTHPTHQNLIIGYHGCDISVRDTVITGHSALSPSTNDYDWLGHGRYFWESNHDRALEFAQESAERHGHILTPAVLGAVFTLGHCLDLLDARSLKLVRSAHAYLVLSYANVGSTLPTNHGENLKLRHLDCAVINSLHDYRMSDGLPPFDSVRAAFIEGNELYPSAGFRDKNHVQICIRNQECIKAYFLPRLGGTIPVEFRLI